MKHLFIIRLIAGLVFLFFGILHFVSPENFKHILQASNLPLADFNLIFVPIVEVVVGALLILGLYTRLIAIIGCITMAIAFYATITILHLDPSQLPDGMTEKPFSPPLIVPIIIFLMCLYVLIFGAGAWSIDKRKKKNPS
ncbi:DoxX family protein [Simkania negevensis]|uniref:DoxX family protein n=1 Tax=Simkania negevensis (strain ATCC VR-1471 / DSM 27360 / Z) TaxID=331113 RepID=F8L3D4_SIMNZ|nr:DoxX family protein [Simkania negevensis]CCB89781.1 hypothetical protein SNE_A19040 [Simkania negevensis Z]